MKFKENDSYTFKSNTTAEVPMLDDISQGINWMLGNHIEVLSLKTFPRIPNVSFSFNLQSQGSLIKNAIKLAKFHGDHGKGREGKTVRSGACWKNNNDSQLTELWFISLNNIFMINVILL